jgi:hypothetical protein
VSALEDAAKAEFDAAEKKLDAATLAYTLQLEELAKIEQVLAGAREDMKRAEGVMAVLSGEAIPQVEEVAVEKEVIPPKKEVKPDPDNPYANIPCKACGTVGSLYQTMMGAAGKGGDNGSAIPMLVCGAPRCGSQTLAQ